jgi:predicted PurR-regulated permease PerM
LAIVILIPIVVFFWLRDDKLFYEKFMKLVPGRLKEKTKDIFEEIDMVLQNYFVGQLMVAGVLGVLTYIGYLIIGLPNALFLSIFSMIFSIIPFLGPLVGILPAIFIGWTVDLFMIAKVIIVLAITQQLEGNVVRPKIMGTRLEIHPLAIIFLVIIAVTQFGFMGAFFVIPLYAVARIVIRNILEDAK